MGVGKDDTGTDGLGGILLVSRVIESIFSGLSLGAVYAIVAIGFSFLFAAGRYLNFGQGDWVMFTGMTAAAVATRWNLALGLVAAIGVGIVISLGCYEVVLKRSRSQDVLSLSLVLLASGLVLQGLALYLWGPNPVGIGQASLLRAFHIWGATFTELSVITVVLGAITVVCLQVFFRLSKLGRAMAAWAGNREAAALIGIDVRKVTLVAFTLAGVLTGLAGFLILLQSGLYFQSGLYLTLDAFSAAALAGFDRPTRVVIGACLIGMIQAFAESYIGGTANEVVSLGALLVILIIVGPRYGAVGHGADAEVSRDIVRL